MKRWAGYRARAAAVVTFAGAVVLALAAGAPAAAQSWSYVIGVARVQQQAQFCESEEETLALAALFRRKGPRAGYFALKQIYDCRTEVATFTPLEVVESVVLQAKNGEYYMHFVRVRMDDGAARYLVTAREIRE